MIRSKVLFKKNLKLIQIRLCWVWSNCVLFSLSADHQSIFQLEKWSARFEIHQRSRIFDKNNSFLLENFDITCFRFLIITPILYLMVDRSKSDLEKVLVLFLIFSNKFLIKITSKMTCWTSKVGVFAQKCDPIGIFQIF